MRSARELLEKRLCIHISKSIDPCNSNNHKTLLPIKKGNVYCKFNAPPPEPEPETEPEPDPTHATEDLNKQKYTEEDADK